MRSDWKATALSFPSRQIEDSLPRNAPWEEEIGSTSERLQWFLFHSFHELEQIK